MNILIIGSGGREHTIAWKCNQSPICKTIYASPGSPGIDSLGISTGIAVDDIDSLVSFAKNNSIDLTIVGPEYPLSLGIVDRFQEEGLKIFGPKKAAAMLETSKHFAKEVMIEAGVPTASFGDFYNEADALKYLEDNSAPLVVKADGLAAGKGVFVCMTNDEAINAVKEVFSNFKASKIIIEDFIEGREVSFIVVTDGKKIIPLATAHDYKRIYENDQGPNTGGMGCVSPSPRMTKEQQMWVIENVMQPVVDCMAKRGTPFVGFLYAGLIIDQNENIKVLEFNTRLGDPETQVILPRMKSDLVKLLFDVLDAKEIEEPLWEDRQAVCVVLASGGYPKSSSRGEVISGLEHIPILSDTFLFHAGTARNNGQIVTDGGRVLGVTSLGGSLEETRAKTYKAVDMIQFKGLHVRRDIGVS